MSIIKIKNVSKEYIKEKQLIYAIKNVTYTFEKGKLYAIMGNSGAGKSTLLQCIGLLDSVTNGNIYIDEKEITKLNDIEISNIRKKKIGFIFQNYYLNPSMSAYENVMLPIILDKKISFKAKKKTPRTWGVL